jgi:hypothetical protein
MKKIVYLLSAIAAGFSSSALADISVSGSGHFGYVSGDSDQRVAGSGGVKFALSTTTANGTTITSAGGITSDLEGTASNAITGLSSLTFATGGATIVLGNDVAVPQNGGFGSVASDLADVGHQSIDASPAVGTDADQDGSGVSFSSAFGTSTVTAVYVWDDTLVDPQGQGNPDSGTQSYGLGISMPMGAATLVASYGVSQDSSTENDTLAGIGATFAAGPGTLSVGYQQSTGEVDASAISGKFSMNLDADTTAAIGLKQADEGSLNASTTEAKITRAIGGGASVYAELKSSSGNATGVGSATADAASTFAIGTNVAF